MKVSQVGADGRLVPFHGEWAHHLGESYVTFAKFCFNKFSCTYNNNMVNTIATNTNGWPCSFLGINVKRNCPY